MTNGCCGQDLNKLVVNVSNLDQKCDKDPCDLSDAGTLVDGDAVKVCDPVSGEVLKTFAATIDTNTFVTITDNGDGTVTGVNVDESIVTWSKTDTFAVINDNGDGTANTINADGSAGPCILTCDYSPPADPPSAAVTVSGGQSADDVDITLSGQSHSSCGTPGILSAIWELFEDGNATAIADGTDLPSAVTLPDLTSYTGPFYITYVTTDACGISNIGSTAFSVAIAGDPSPSTTVNVPDGQDKTAVVATVTYVPSPDCATPGVTSSSYTLYDGVGTVIPTVAVLTFVAGVNPGEEVATVTLPDLTSYSGTFKLEATTTDACATSTLSHATFNVEATDTNTYGIPSIATVAGTDFFGDSYAIGDDIVTYPGGVVKQKVALDRASYTMTTNIPFPDATTITPVFETLNYDNNSLAVGNTFVIKKEGDYLIGLSFPLHNDNATLKEFFASIWIDGTDRYIIATHDSGPLTNDLHDDEGGSGSIGVHLSVGAVVTYEINNDINGGTLQLGKSNMFIHQLG